MSTLYNAIDYIRESATSERDKGTKFERLTRFFLKNDPLWKSRLSEVWMWSNAPTNDGKDLGIDLVALDKEDGTYWAIQCKCFDDDATLEYKDVATFYGKTGNKGMYPHTMIVTTAARFSGNLDAVSSEWNTVRIFADDMSESEIDYQDWIDGKTVSNRTIKEPRPHQRRAIDDCLRGFKDNDRGQLIMACGTGKTITSLRLVEELLERYATKRGEDGQVGEVGEVGEVGGRVLFLAPSIALVGQSMREWANQSKLPMTCAVVCSDAKASNIDEDTWESSLKDLPYPASTDPGLLYRQMKDRDPNSLNVIFSTYQSIQVVSDAQKMGLPAFDVIVCDEAHRTTGMAEQGKPEEASEFVKVHDNNIVRGKKRLYMTATPRIYGDRAVRIANIDSYVVSSMDDQIVYGPEFHRLSFGRAIDENLLTDYKVIALTVEEDVVSKVYQKAMTEENGEFTVTESSRIIGCWKGLLDQGKDDGVKLKNAVAFCSTIAESKRISEDFQRTVDAYIDFEKEQGKELPEFRCKIEHVDGTMDSKLRRGKLQWLEETETGEDASCRILSNARCLAEGVDVPNLDAVLFLQPKKSQVEITQAVGRVMRKFEGKDYGYIILPIVIPAGMTAEEALDDNETFAVVWDVLKALRSHDERLDARINAIPYDRNQAEPVVGVSRGVGADPEGEEGVPVDANDGEDGAADGEEANGKWVQRDLLRDFDISGKKLQEAINALIVKKCGTKIYWDVWAKDIAEIAVRHIQRIGEIIHTDDAAKEEFEKFLRGLKDSLNESINEEQAVEMLAQHVITLPVFEALFGGADFANSNPVSGAMEKMLTVLRRYTLETEEERRELDDLYASVRMRAEGIRTDAGRQAVIKDLYESFFKEAFKATSEKMGIVYTPNQVVDYILHATDRLLYKEFGQHLYDKGVHILDAFTGTGTFIVNLINDKELMPVEKLPYKYENEIHCNEIMLLAYYIATINIEHAFHSRVGGEYKSFPGAVLTDTFQMYEENDPLDVEMFVENSERVLKQIETPIHVLVGNPPWSALQRSENDNNKNESYPTLDRRIALSYVAKSNATGTMKLYDSYIRAFRWASDRIGDRGVISFVTNAGWLRGVSMDGFRKSLVDEFDSIYIFDLRGNQRTQGEESRKEGGKIFGSGSRAPVAITMLVKNPCDTHHGAIYYHDVGDYLSREEKLSLVGKAVKNEDFDWEDIVPDKYGDWFSKRDVAFTAFVPMGISKIKPPYGVFYIYSMGVVTNRDAWVINYSADRVNSNVNRCVLFFEEQLVRWIQSDSSLDIDDFVDNDPKRISWTRSLKQRLKRKENLSFNKLRIQAILYRPFCKQFLYFDRNLNEMVYQQEKLWPNNRLKNQMICVSGTKGFTALVSNYLVDLHFVGDTQCFPLYWYEKDADGKYIRHDAITDESLDFFRRIYPGGFVGRPKYKGGQDISKEDIFYYIYGILHSPEYRQRFESNLKKELPRIPMSSNFRLFSAAGRNLADIHLNYEEAELYPLRVIGNAENPGRVEKMRWGKKRNTESGKMEADKSTLIYNGNLTFKGIPEDAHRYVINGRTPLEWMIDRYQVKTDKASGIVNDPNEYSDDPLYIPNLVRRLVTVSIETMKVIDNMPKIAEIECKESMPDAWKVQEG